MNTQRTDAFSEFGTESSGLAELRASKESKNQTAESRRKLLSEIASGMRILEDRYYNLRKKAQLTDQALIETQRKFSKEKRLLADELVETRMKLHDLIEDIKLMKGELQQAAKQNDIKVIQKYLDMWEPMQFVTRKEVEDILENMDIKQ